MINLLQICVKLNNYQFFNSIKCKYKLPSNYMFALNNITRCMQNKSNSSSSRTEQHQQIEFHKIVEEKNKINFDQFICERRQQSKQSVVIQVNSEKSYPELFSYCAKFGNIIGSYHYSIPQNYRKSNQQQQLQQDNNLNNSHYILLEYSNPNEVYELLKSSIYDSDEGGVPAISHFLWFRSGPKSQKLEKINPINLCITNGTQKITSTQELTDWLNVAESIDEQILLLHRSTYLNDIGVRLRFLAAQQIEYAMSSIFPSCQVFPFGSTVNGFGKNECDLDLILSLDSSNERLPQTPKNSDPTKRLVFHIKETLINGRSQIQRQMETISDVLQLFLPGVSHVRRILQARIPIIRYHHEYLDVEVDLSMSNLSGFYMSELFYMFGQIDERVQPFVFCVRRWAQTVGLTNPSPGRWISNFSLTCLIIYFLQQLKNPVLPSINFLMNAARPQDVRIIKYENINCSFLRDLNQLNFPSTNEDKLSHLLLQFFEFYSQMDFTNRAISLNESKTILKPDHSAMYIVNPLEQQLNVSKNVSLEECERFRMEVRNGAWILESSLDTNNNNNRLNTLSADPSSISSQMESSAKPWGLLNILQSHKDTLIRPHMFFKSRMVDVSDLFDDKNVTTTVNTDSDNSNSKMNESMKQNDLSGNNVEDTQKSIVYKNDLIKNYIENIQRKGKKDIKQLKYENNGNQSNGSSEQLPLPSTRSSKRRR